MITRALLSKLFYFSFVIIKVLIISFVIPDIIDLFICEKLFLELIRLLLFEIPFFYSFCYLKMFVFPPSPTCEITTMRK